VVRNDHTALRNIISTLPRLAKARDVIIEDESVATELDVDDVSAVIDRRDVPLRETPLHLAVRLKDPVSAAILMVASADWSALQEAVSNREENIAMIIATCYQPLAWAKWCHRLPRIVSSANRIRDFYMEITFHFQSSDIPLIGRIAPSDTYRIWKRGSNLGADSCRARILERLPQRIDHKILFLALYMEHEASISYPFSPFSLIAPDAPLADLTIMNTQMAQRPSSTEREQVCCADGGEICFAYTAALTVSVQ
ncbi:ankyrin repeat domain-containing protein 13C-B isoform X2, partial [Tanacetum coccineum]